MLMHSCDGLGGLAVGRDPGVLLAQPDAQGVDHRLAAVLSNALTFCRRKAIDLALDGEQGVDAGNGFDADRRLVEPRQVEEVAPRMGPAGDLDDRPGLPVRLVEPIVAAVGVSLHQPVPGGQMRFWMRRRAIGREVVDRGRRIRAGEWPVVAHIGP